MPSLNTWLQRKARLNEAKGGARTYVVCDGARVIAFYSLAASSVERRRVSSRVGRNMPEPIPVILLGQLAVDTDYQGRGLGSDLLIDAGKRALTAADVIGARAIVVQAFDQDAKKFYAPFGFLPVGYPFDSGSHKMLWSRESIYQEANPEVTALARRGAA